MAGTELSVEGGTEIEIEIEDGAAVTEQPKTAEEAVANLRRDLHERTAADTTQAKVNEDAERRISEATQQTAQARADAAKANVRAAGEAQARRAAELDSIASSLQAAESRGTQLTADHAAALEAGEFKKASELALQIATVGADISNLKNGKNALEQEIKTNPKIEAAKAPDATQTELEDRFISSQDPANAAWIRANRARFFGDQAFQKKAVAASGKLVHLDGVKTTDSDYIEKLEVELGMRKAPAAEAETTVSRQTETSRQAASETVPARSAPARTAAAPPSRQAPTSSRSVEKVTLTPEEVAIARQTFTPEIIGKNADGSPKDPIQAYAKRKLELQKEGRRF